MAEDSIWDRKPHLRLIGGSSTATEDESKLSADMTTWAENELEKRQWLAEGFLLIGSVSLIVGPASAGKSLLALSMGVACALGLDWGPFKPRYLPRRAVVQEEEEFDDLPRDAVEKPFSKRGPMRVSLVNIEDDNMEQKRRISATLRQFGKTPADLGGRLARIHPKGLATLVRWVRDPDGNDFRIEPTPLMAQLEAHVIEFRTQVLIIDPIIEVFAGEETNEPFRAMVAFFRLFAAKYRLSIVLVHHTRKGSSLGAGDQDISRGGSSLTAAARVVLTCLPMSKADAEAMGIGLNIMHQFIRLDGAKMNYSMRGNCHWFEKTSELLDNEEMTPALRPWVPPSTPDADQEMLLALAAEIAKGYDNQPYIAALNGTINSVSRLFGKYDIPPHGRKKMLEAIFKMGVSAHEFMNADSKPRIGLRTKDGFPRAKWVDMAGAELPPAVRQSPPESPPATQESPPDDDSFVLSWER